MNRVDEFTQAMIMFNDKVLNDNLSDEIVKKIYQDSNFIKLVKKNKVKIADICILLKCDEEDQEISNFRFEIEVALDHGDLSEELSELMSDLASEDYEQLSKLYEQEVCKINEAYEKVLNIRFEEGVDFRDYIQGWIVNIVD